MPEDIRHYPVNRHGTKQRNKRIEDHIHIIMTKTENIENGKDLDKYICFQIIPVRILGSEKGRQTFGLIRIVK